MIMGCWFNRRTPFFSAFMFFSSIPCLAIARKRSSRCENGSPFTAPAQRGFLPASEWPGRRGIRGRAKVGFSGERQSNRRVPSAHMSNELLGDGCHPVTVRPLLSKKYRGPTCCRSCPASKASPDKAFSSQDTPRRFHFIWFGHEEFCRRTSPTLNKRRQARCFRRSGNPGAAFFCTHFFFGCIGARPSSRFPKGDARGSPPVGTAPTAPDESGAVFSHSP